MRELMLMFLGAAIGTILTSSILWEQIDYTLSKRNKEIQTWRDSLAKCNGKLKTHVCYPY